MKVLVSRPDKIGDVILALHTIKQLKKIHPEYQVFIHIAEYTRKLVENISFVDGIVTNIDEIKAEKFDVVVDLMAKFRHAWVFAQAGISRRVGNSARAHSFLYNRRRYIRRSKAILNEAEYNWQLVSLIDLEDRHSSLTESLSLTDFNAVIDYQEFDDYIVLMPSITVSAIGWSFENWLKSGELLSKKYPEKKIIYLLGPAEKSLEENILLRHSDNSQIKVRSFQEFPEVLGFLKNASYYVGTSTGITHLAAAVGLEGLALYPERLSMHPQRWLPFNSKLQVISLDRHPTAEQVSEICFNRVPESLNPLSREKVSAFIVCCNEEKNIKKAINSVSWCDEVVVVDSGSTDSTLDIVKKYTDQIFHNPWPGNRAQKEFALKKCQHKWVLNIDADEEVSMELRGQLTAILAKRTKQHRGYNISRLIYYFDRWWDKGGWYPEYRMRFFQKEYINWGGNDPHEKAILTGRPARIKAHLFHYTYDNVDNQVKSLQTHAYMMAKSLAEEGRSCYVFNVVVNPLFRFFKFFILKSGYREGKVGFFVAILESYYTFLKYLMFWEIKHQKNTITSKVLKN